MDVVTALTIAGSAITVSGMVIAALLNYAKSLNKEKEWEKPLEEVKNEIQSHKITTIRQISEIENKLKLLSLDSTQIAEVKSWILRLETSIDQESAKLEGKIDELMKLVISLLQGKR